MVKRLLSSPSKKKRTNRSPIKQANETPPCTPSPTHQVTKIIVQTRPETRRSSNFTANNETDKLNDDSNSLQDGANYFDDDCDNSTYISDLSATQYTHSTKAMIRDMHYSNETDGRSTNQKFPLQDPGTLLQTVMGSCVSDIVSRVGLGQTSLQDDNEPRNIWGMAPSDDDSTSDEEESYLEKNKHHEDIELVYQPISEKDEDPPQQLICQPCKEDGHIPRFPPNVAKMLASSNLPKKKKKNKNNRSVDSQKDGKSSKKENQQLLKENGNTSIDVLVTKKSERVESISNDNLNTSRIKKSKSEAHKAQLEELVSSEDAGSQKKDNGIVEKSSSKTKWNSLKLKSKKKQSQHEKPETKSQKKSVPSRMSQAIGRLSKTKQKKRDMKTKPALAKNQGRWKVAEDPNTRKTYFYHSGTKEVTWQKPPSFNEWKPIVDKESNKHYFYNRITKETTWDIPKDFEEWRAIRDANNENRIYYYNILTKERRWDEPEEYKEQLNITSIQNNNTKEPNLRTKNKESVDTNSPSFKVGKSEQKQTTLNRGFNTRKSAAVKISSNESNEYDLDHVLRSIDSSNKVDTKEPITTRPLAPPAVDLNPKQLHLMKLLTKYNPDEPTTNTIFVRKIAVGKEEKIIDELEGLLEDTPFDEVPAATQHFLKKHQIDQHLNDDDDDVIKGSSLTRTNSLKSIKTVKTLASHKTNYSTVSMNSRVKSNMTETTNKVNNTSSRRLFHSKLNYSTIPSTEEKLDEEDLSQSTPTSLTSAEADTPQKDKVQFDEIQNFITELEVPESRRKQPLHAIADRKLNFSPRRKLQNDLPSSPNGVDLSPSGNKNMFLDYDSSYGADEDDTVGNEVHGGVDFNEQNPGKQKTRDNRRSKRFDSKQRQKKLTVEKSNSKRSQVRQKASNNISSKNQNGVSSTSVRNSSERIDVQSKHTALNTNNPNIQLRKRFGARSLAQYNDHEEVLSHEDASTFSWDDNTVTSDSEFSFDVSVGSADTY